jgi:hypothetical protein
LSAAEVTSLAASLNRSQLLRLGAGARLKELRDEIAAIEEAFPDLRPVAQRFGRRRGSRKTARSSAQTAASRERQTGSDAGASKPRRRQWTAAQRKAAADRMKAYWSKRNAARKK